jgi:predicted solute-binding protein
VLFNKIVNGQVPDYLTELVPPTVSDTNNYNLRNRLNISQLSYRLYRKCSEHSFLYPHEQEALGTNFDLNKSLFRELHLFLRN